MTNSGDAAEQIVRMSLEGTEVALKLTGSAAKKYRSGTLHHCEERRQEQDQGASAAQRHAEKRQGAEGVHHQ